MTDVVQVDTIVAPVAPPAPSSGTSVHRSRVEKMRQYFKNRPKEKIRIRLSDGDQWVQINGYAFSIQAGKEVSVPVDVADILRDAGVL